jgi:hypothetical protein
VHIPGGDMRSVQAMMQYAPQLLPSPFSKSTNVDSEFSSTVSLDTSEVRVLTTIENLSIVGEEEVNGVKSWFESEWCRDDGVWTLRIETLLYVRQRYCIGCTNVLNIVILAVGKFATSLCLMYLTLHLIRLPIWHLWAAASNCAVCTKTLSLRIIFTLNVQLPIQTQKLPLTNAALNITPPWWPRSPELIYLIYHVSTQVRNLRMGH